MPAQETALLLVGVDPITADVREGAGEMAADAMSEALFPSGQSYRLAEPGTDIGANLAIKAGPRDEVLVFSSPSTEGSATMMMEVMERMMMEGMMATTTTTKEMATWGTVPQVQAVRRRRHRVTRPLHAGMGGRQR